MAIIAHIDLDAFFASCEEQRDPDAAGQPLVVCNYAGRDDSGGAVTTANYPAREHGIQSAMPVPEARNIAAEADVEFVFTEADHDFYKAVSERVHALVAEMADDIERASIDEAYADLSDRGGYDAAEAAMQELKDEIKAQEGLTASVGIGPNRLVAKIASDHDKPDGLTVVPPGEIDGFLADLSVEELHGVGPKTAAELADMGVGTVRELREVPAQRLVRRFGESAGMALYEKARGEGSTELEEDERKQLSRITTLDRGTRAMRELRPVVRDLSGEVMDRVERRGWRYATVTALCITDQHDTRSRSRTFKAATADRERFYRTAEELVAAFLDEHPDRTLRRVGVRAAGFDRSGQRTLGDF